MDIGITNGLDVCKYILLSSYSKIKIQNVCALSI